MSSTGYCIGCCCCTILITTIVVLAGSIKTLQVNWYGVDYSAITKTINPTVYTSGIHFVGFGHSFIEYPATIQTLEFSDGDKASSGKIYGRSADGLMVNFRAQFQYQLTQGNLTKLYLRYGEDYKTPCIKFSIDSMSDEATRFTASAFFRNITNVKQSMEKKLSDMLMRECFFVVSSLQIQNADLPNEFEHALEATNLAQQQVITEKQNQQAETITQQNAINRAVIQAPRIVTKAEGEISAKVATNEATMQYFKKVQTQQGQSLKSLRVGLNLDTDAKLLDYVKVKTITGFNPANLVLGQQANANPNKP